MFASTSIARMASRYRGLRLVVHRAMMLSRPESSRSRMAGSSSGEISSRRLASAADRLTVSTPTPHSCASR